MEELKIKKINFNPFPCKITRKEFEDGNDGLIYSIVITTNIPSGFNPMDSESMRTQFFVKGLDKRVETFYKVGYHISNNELMLESSNYFKSNKPRNIKIYY